MKDSYQKLVNALGNNRVKFNETLKNYTSLKIGGPADLFFKAQNSEDLVNALKLAYNNKINFFLLGSGTNILFSDQGFRGLVIKNETGEVRLKGLTGKRFLEKKGKSMLNKIFLEVDSGVTINRLVRNTIDQGLSGLESFLGQPGTVGGAMWINAHNINSNKYFGDLVAMAKIFSPDYGVTEVPKYYFHFGYDKSILQTAKDAVISVTLELESSSKDELWQQAKKALLYRQSTQPQGVFSAGCLFRNIDKSSAMRLATPNYSCSAGFLLDTAGLKGASVGGAKFSDAHANFLVNTGEAKSSDVLKLIDLARKKVKEKFGVNLDLEIVLVEENPHNIWKN